MYRNLFHLPVNSRTISPPNKGAAAMDWKRAIEEERAALGRIAALLYALAVLAERAAGRSPVVRSLVLCRRPFHPHSPI
jgi:hypothetical protein